MREKERKNEITAASRRDAVADALRGVAAVLVVCGHLIFRDVNSLADPYYFFPIIYTFHMPLFFFFGGYFGYRTMSGPFPELIRKKAVRLLLPYVTWSTVAVAAKAAAGILAGADISGTPRLWLDTLLYAESLWFFLSLFTVHILGWAFLRLWDRCGIWALLFPAAFMCLPRTPVFAFNMTQGMLPFFLAGLLFTRYGIPYDTYNTTPPPAGDLACWPWRWSSLVPCRCMPLNCGL